MLVSLIEVHSLSYDIDWGENSRDSSLILFGILIVLTGLFFLIIFVLGQFWNIFPVIFAKARTDIDKLRIKSFYGAC